MLALYAAELARARARIGTGSVIFQSRFSTMEYAVAGEGPPAIMIHGTGGALAAMQFAIRHPDRCSPLVVIVPAAFAPGRPPPRPNALGQAIMDYALKSDFLFWAGMVAAEDAMISTLLATEPVLGKRAEAGEQARVRSILRSILPVSARAAGLINDAAWRARPRP
ncbi:MAG TPA: hypothetical protein VG758_07200 [Hyphomicrobiaceae bacterium]|nr:hypothetical protein [Hyphomicrobiaceae bacterium]